MELIYTMPKGALHNRHLKEFSGQYVLRFTPPCTCPERYSISEGTTPLGLAIIWHTLSRVPLSISTKTIARAFDRGHLHGTHRGRWRIIKTCKHNVRVIERMCERE